MNCGFRAHNLIVICFELELYTRGGPIFKSSLGNCPHSVYVLLSLSFSGFQQTGDLFLVLRMSLNSGMMVYVRHIY